MPEEIVPASKESLISLLELAELLGCQCAWVFLDRALPLLAERARVFAYIGFQMVPERCPVRMGSPCHICTETSAWYFFVLFVRFRSLLFRLGRTGAADHLHPSTLLLIWTQRTLTTSSCATTSESCAA